MSTYLDHAATTPLCEEARAAMEPFWSVRFGNASEPHRLGRDARAALERARRDVADLLEAEPRQVVFTSGGTEADNLAVLGLAGEPPGRLLVSSIEHPAVREPARSLERRGFEVGWLPVDGDGVVEPAAVEDLLRPGDRLLAVMWANNVTGAVQPLAELAALARERGVPLHVDAVQALAALPLSFRSSGVETLALSAHKLHGPKGVGALFARDPARLSPLLFGGGQEEGLRPGTENVAGAVGLAAALAAQQGRDDHRRELRDRLERALEAIFGVRPLSTGAERLCGHSLLLVEGVRAELLVLALDEAGYAVSAGSACSSGDSAPSHVLTAQGLAPEEARCAVRVSLGAGTTAAEIDGFAAALAEAAARLRSAALV